MTANYSTTAIILAGGLGTRLRTVVTDRQKVAAEVAGHPFIYHIIRQVKDAGIKNIVLCVGHKAESVEQCIYGCGFDLDIIFSEEKSPLGTAGAVRLAMNRTDADELLVLNGDSYLDADISDFMTWKQQCGAPACLLLKQMDDVSRYGRVTLDQEGRVLAFDEKGAFSGAGMINAGIYLFDRSVLTMIPEKIKCSMEIELFPSLAAKGILYGSISHGAFIDIGTPESYAEAHDFFERNRIK